jgi:hypothetical protein
MTCKDIKQDLALAAMDCLDEARLLQIREHCRDCPACAAQLQQFRSIALAHSRVAAECDALPLHYHPSRARGSHRVAGRRRIAPDPIWRWLLPIGAIAALAFAFVILDQPIRPPTAQKVPPSALPVPLDHAPSLAVYRNAIEKSGDASLDALLARDAERLLRPTPGQEMRELRGEVF